jgi:hypothetical protein
MLHLLVLGCGGLTGNTSRFVLQIEQSSTSLPKTRVELGSFTWVPEGNNVVITAGTYRWGVFTKMDEENFKESLINTLGTVSWPSVDYPNSDWHVHVVLGRHIVAHDNNSASALAIIS